MAKTAKKISKTAAIRDALKKVKNGSPTEVAKVLNKQGVKVTPAYVSTIKASDKRKALNGNSGRKPGRPVGSGRKKMSGSSSVEDLRQASELMLKAVDLVLKAGAKEAKQLVNMAEQMVDRISDDS
ncbi:MAG: hypothetical protein O7F71_06800 [Gammaproteobacteria bacterium]|nr:hypothetical protein [Gammaproteobacteria bacterium]